MPSRASAEGPALKRALAQSRLPAAREALSTAEAPYEGASLMLLVDIENSDAIADMVLAMLPDFPEPKKR